jgi:hypothetical protein
VGGEGGPVINLPTDHAVTQSSLLRLHHVLASSLIAPPDACFGVSSPGKHL